MAEGSLLTEGVNPGAAPTAPTAPPGRPDYIPEKFWKDGAPDVENLGRSYFNLEKLASSDNRVARPLSDDDSEGWDRWYRATGRPDKPDDYEFKRPEQVPQSLGYDEEAEKSFRTWAHVNGLSKRQANNLYDNYVKTRLEQHAAWETSQKQARQQLEDALRREHGQRYDVVLQDNRALLQQHADPDFLKFLDESNLGNDPRMVRFLHRLNRGAVGDTRLKGPPVAEVQGDPHAAISDFRQKHDKALMDKHHPDHERRVKEFNALFERAFPS